MRLFLFTATYPFGIRETFLEEEILYLCQEFENVIIIPLSGRGCPTRRVPSNCQVVKPIISSRLLQYTKGLLYLKSLRLYLKDFFENKVYLSSTKFEEWLVSMVLTNNLLRSKEIKTLFAEMSNEDICYFYWGKGSNIISCFFKGKAKFVSRFHGEWDLWEESAGDYAPCRKQLSMSLNYAVFISKKGEIYFKNKYPNCNTVVFPLGTMDYGCRQLVVKDDVIRVVSCSTVYPLKRVPLIFDVLNSMTSYSIEWTHIGDGVSFTYLKSLVSESKGGHLTVNLLGGMTHEEVMNYYKKHSFSLFINLSTQEGVPVSIMEAESFNIPVIATNVGGTSEVVTEESGLLVSANPSVDEIKNAILRLLNMDLSPRLFWENHYCARSNYSSFASFLKSL